MFPEKLYSSTFDTNSWTDFVSDTLEMSELERKKFALSCRSDFYCKLGRHVNTCNTNLASNWQQITNNRSPGSNRGRNLRENETGKVCLQQKVSKYPQLIQTMSRDYLPLWSYNFHEFFQRLWQTWQTFFGNDAAFWATISHLRIIYKVNINAKWKIPLLWPSMTLL